MTEERRPDGQRLGAGLAVATVGCDQISKFYLLFVVHHPDSGPIRISPILDISLVWNQGISYGLFQQDGAIGRWMLVGASLAAIVFIGVWLSRTKSRVTAAALGLIAGGALGNAIDRALHGAVIDFLHLHGGSVSWLDFPYSFNLADTAISLGVVLLLTESLFAKPDALEQKRETS